MHVISASRRTDIPAFHAEWFMNRIRQRTVRVRQPFGMGTSDVSLAPEDVIAIVFWTKNAAPIIPWLDELADRGYCFTFLYTINNYPTFLEPHVPSMGHTLKVLEALAKRLPDSFLRWRYDTIVLTDRTDRQWHMRNFSHLCKALAAYTKECIFSFCDYYKKTTRNMSLNVPDYYVPDENQSRAMAEEMAEIAADYDIRMASCAHDFLVSETIAKARCIDPEFLRRVVNITSGQEALSALKLAPSRKECGCVASRDIGAYDTCGHGCVYCYANSNPELARANLARIRVDHVSLHPDSAMP